MLYRLRRRRDSLPLRLVHRLARERLRIDGVDLAAVVDEPVAGLTYRKWGGEQRAKPGDWLVDNGGEVDTVDAESFAREAMYEPQR